MFFISETKLDISFRDSIFDVPGYKLKRKDRNLHGGGVAAFIRSDIPARRRKDLESQNLENITLEVTLNKTNGCFLYVYRPPDFPDELFGNDLSKTLDKCLTLYDHYAILGDLNYDLLSDVKKRPLTDFMEFFSLTNIIKEATCFKKNCTPSLLDVILTNSQHLCMRTLNFTTGVSDCHNLISTVIYSSCPSYEKTKISQAVTLGIADWCTSK